MKIYFTLNILGPKLPVKLLYFKMVTSPTGKGVVVIGGLCHRKNEYSDAIFELSGESTETLKWTLLEQKLQIARSYHLSFYIPNQVCKDINSMLYGMEAE